MKHVHETCSLTIIEKGKQKHLPLHVHVHVRGIVLNLIVNY